MCVLIPPCGRSLVPVNADNSRSEAGRPHASYPDISFAVDTCDDAFQSQVGGQRARGRGQKGREEGRGQGQRRRVMV